MNHDKDPYEPTSTMEGNRGLVAVAQLSPFR